MQFRLSPLVACVLLLGCQRLPLERPITNAARAPISEESEMRSFIRLMNEYRVQHGCAPLQWDERIAEVAQRHSEDMARRHYFHHNSPEGSSPFERLRSADVSFRRAAENIATGQFTGSQVLDDWLESPGHRRNIEECRYTHHGLGLSRTYWTHDFVTVTQ
jgi:uncharacterized protein YkwD